MRELSWKPIRKGRTYCSPACGCKCTYEDYKKARKLALDTRKVMYNPKGWKIRVWENAGWHSSLERGGLQLYIHTYTFDDRPSYSVLFSRNNSGGGEVFWGLGNKSFRDPNKAVLEQLRQARKFIRECTKAVEFVDDMRLT